MPSEILDLFKTLSPTISSAWQIFKFWWWLPLPFILWWPFSFLWLWWRGDLFIKKTKFILLEVRIPKEILKPIRAMETVMDGLWQILHNPPDWWEKWINGKKNLSYSFEIVSIGGEPNFFIRIPKTVRDSVEAAVYSQYPEAEILEADDYTKHIPSDIPNKDWDLWGADYKLLRPNAYPIKTYLRFETEREPLEEKRIDPLAGLLEAMAKVKPGEQLWIQIIADPVTNKRISWITEGKRIRDKIARRTEKAPRKPMLMEAADIFISGEAPGKSKKEEKEIIPPEMKLTPGEREVISGVEQKISKPGFRTDIRFIYLGKREVFFKPKLRLPFSYFAAFTTENLNKLVPYGQPLITKVHKSWFLPLNLFRNRRLFLRKRAIFRKYKSRVNPYYPRRKKSFVLNTEEMASLFHLPGRRVAPAPFVERIEAKKGEAPPGLPTG